MKKIHVVTWCPTCMSYLLFACKLTVYNLIAICNVLFSADIEKEERAYIMGRQCIIILHILADLGSEFGKSYLRKLDTDNGVISKAYYTSNLLIT